MMSVSYTHLVKKTFKPEFINRLSDMVVFNDMDKHMAELILAKMCIRDRTKTYRAICGETLQQPGVVALIAAIVSIVMKEWAYRCV